MERQVETCPTRFKFCDAPMGLWGMAVASVPRALLWAGLSGGLWPGWLAGGPSARRIRQMRFPGLPHAYPREYVRVGMAHVGVMGILAGRLPGGLRVILTAGESPLDWMFHESLRFDIRVTS